MSTFNCCTKCLRSPGIIHDRWADCQASSLGLDDLTTERSFESQATWVIDVFGLILHIIHVSLYNQALVDARLNGAGIKCMYCKCSYFPGYDTLSQPWMCTSTITSGPASYAQCSYSQHICLFANVHTCMVLASRASGCLFGHQILEKNPSGHPNVFVWNF